MTDPSPDTALPLASVAIPAYNHGHYIEACLASVRDQTYPRLELVVIDDGSRDDTLARTEAFLAAHGDRFERVVARTRPNRGVSATSNEAIEECRGEWVHLLGSDDLLYPDKVMAQHEAVRDWGDDDLGLVYADNDRVDATGAVLPAPTRPRPAPGPDHEAYRMLFLGNPVPNPTVALRREAFLKCGGFDEKLFLEDWDCWLRISARSGVARVPKVLAAYRYHPTNTHTNQPRMLEAMLRSFGKFLELHGELIPADLRRRSYRKNLHRLARWAKGDRPAALPRILWDAAASCGRVPQAADYHRYATLIRRTLDAAR
jgi:alpha-1,3-rhamnosyltransferase